MMEKLNMTLSEKIEKELDKELENSLKNEDFCSLIKRAKIPKDVAKKNNSRFI